ncbi:lipase member N [Suncus etruscus]|uniref:lipase member N n=1 Tax=Suncus etruscus TaxID=109475 RepID=UPI00210F36A0|nr:lipase member N [Suncus etruscus]
MTTPLTSPVSIHVHNPTPLEFDQDLLMETYLWLPEIPDIPGIPTMWLFLTMTCLLCGNLKAGGYFNLEDELNPEVLMNISEIIMYNGYPSEEYEVTSPDGYILSINRIPYGRRDANNTGPRPIVYLQHALFTDNISWLENYANGSLGFLLADAGYDVWMGNIRGSTWSRRHKTLSATEEEYWAFSFDEMAKYDLPEIIDFVVNKTGQEKLYFVGHSLGTTIGFAAFSTMPELAQRIKMQFALSPVASLKYPTGILTKILLFSNFEIKKMIGTKGVMLGEEKKKATVVKLCKKKILYSLCTELLSLWAGYNKKNLNMSRVDVYLSHAPTGASVQTILHLKQLYGTDKLRAYDWGSEAENMHHYNQSHPPFYDLTTMKVPTAIWAGGHDVMITIKDVLRILPQIRDLRYFDFLPEWNHFDFIWGLDAAKRVYSKIIDLMKANP